jgi:hypothetical protein
MPENLTQFEYDYFVFDGDEVPVSKRVEINGEPYILEIQYNEVGKFFPVILYDLDMNILLISKLSYANYTFFDITENVGFRKKLIPLNIANLYQDSRVTLENFGKTVFLFVI